VRKQLNDLLEEVERNYERGLILFNMQVSNMSTSEKSLYIDKILLTKPVVKDMFKMGDPEILNQLNNIKSFQRFVMAIKEGIMIPNNNQKATLLTVCKDKNELSKAYYAFTEAKLLISDINSWLYWFNGTPCDKPTRIKWVFDKKKSSLIYFLNKLCPNFSPDGQQRKNKEANLIFEEIEGRKIDSNDRVSKNNKSCNPIDSVFVSLK